jgi:hypothetical protein
VKVEAVQVIRQQDFLAGLLFTLIGGAFAWAAASYPLGNSSRMGPGFFPLLLGAKLALLGNVLMLRTALRSSAGPKLTGTWALRPLFFILAANLVFGVALAGIPPLGLPPVGFVAGVYLLTTVASLAGDRVRVRETALLATALAALSYVAFVLLLKLPFPVWPAFLLD